MHFFNTHISSKAITNVQDVLRSGWVSEGRLVKEFESKLSMSLGLRNPVAVNSGTSALHLALVLSQIGPGDEVILPPQTFIATGLVVLMQAATPVFADIQIGTGNIDPVSIRQSITERTKAIIAVHWGGYPCDLDEIHAISKEYSLTVIEDAAHALGATYRGQAIGSISPFTAFSFQATKHLTTGDGGLLCCATKETFERAKRKRWLGLDRDGGAVSPLGERKCEVAELGYKYHMNDLSAAVGLGNLEDLGANLRRRRRLAEFYRVELSSVPGVTLLDYNPDRESSYWLFTLLVERRAEFIARLKTHGIPTSVVHQRIDRHPVFGGVRPDLAAQGSFNEAQVSIPVHEALSDDQAHRIVCAIREGW